MLLYPNTDANLLTDLLVWWRLADFLQYLLSQRFYWREQYHEEVDECLQQRELYI